MDLPFIDNAETKDTITVKVLQFKESGYELTGLEVMLDSIMHTRASDLEISLTHDNLTVTVVNHVSDLGANFLWIRLKDDATKLIVNGATPFSGDYKPHTPLNAFNGLDPDGEWILTVYDNQAGHTGTLKAWGIKPLFEKPVSVNEPEQAAREPKLRLFQNIPNPFTGTTRINWASETGGATTMKVYNLNGQGVAIQVDKYLPEGEYSVDFNSTGLVPGGYYYRLQVGNYILARKCIIW
jgi:subtilisin-like proprotein convertase family protein